MKKICILISFLLVSLLFTYNISEIKGEVMLKGDPDIRIGLNKDSTGLMLLKGDILETKTGSKVMVDDEESFFELFENSEVRFEESEFIMIKGNIFVDCLKVPIIIEGEKLDLSDARAYCDMNSLEIVEGTFKFKNRTFRSGDILNIKDISISVPKEQINTVVPPKKEIKVKKDELTSKEKTGINRSSLSKAKAGDFDAAISILENALVKSPQETTFLNNLGVMYFQKKDYDKAMDSLKQVLLLRPEDPSAYYNIICIFSINKDEINTVLWYRQAKPYLTEKFIEAMKKDADLEFFRKIMADEI